VRGRCMGEVRGLHALGRRVSLHGIFFLRHGQAPDDRARPHWGVVSPRMCDDPPDFPAPWMDSWTLPQSVTYLS